MGGGDKCRHQINGRSLLDRVIERARPQVSTLILNANGDLSRFADTGLAVVADVVTGQMGPLAGILTGLEWTATNTHGHRWVASMACDTPFFPRDLVSRLETAVVSHGAQIALAASHARLHPVFGIWPVNLAPALRNAMVEDGIRKIDQWAARYHVAVVEFGTNSIDPFFNINSPEDISLAQSMV